VRVRVRVGRRNRDWEREGSHLGERKERGREHRVVLLGQTEVVRRLK